MQSIFKVGEEWFEPVLRIYTHAHARARAHRHVYVQGVPGGMCQTSGECSLG